jgi:protocatechuate 3,4-dioxygenase beta subunit
MNKIIQIACSLLTMLFLINSTKADEIDKMHDDMQLKRETIFRCRVTEQMGHILEKPKKINKNNNLTRKPENLFFSKGKSVILEGYILDKNCVPIPNATINVWQKNNFGVNQYDLKGKNLRNEPEKLKEFDTHFTNNGSSASDNTGFYNFILLQPCKNCSKNFDFAVDEKSKKFKNLESIATFSSISNKNTNNNDENDRQNDVRLEKYKQIINRNKNLTLKQELKILCEITSDTNNDKDISQNNTDKYTNLINSGQAIAKFIGFRNNKPIYRMDLVLDGQNYYRKY